MDNKRLAEIRADVEKYAKHQRFGEHELSAREIDRLELDDFPKYVSELLTALSSLPPALDVSAIESKLEAIRGIKLEPYCLDEIRTLATECLALIRGEK